MCTQTRLDDGNVIEQDTYSAQWIRFQKNTELAFRPNVPVVTLQLHTVNSYSSVVRLSHPTIGRWPCPLQTTQLGKVSILSFNHFFWCFFNKFRARFYNSIRLRPKIILSPDCRREKTELTINTKRIKRWRTVWLYCMQLKGSPS